jgi:hypothetical protein
LRAMAVDYRRQVRHEKVKHSFADYHTAVPLSYLFLPSY